MLELGWIKTLRYWNPLPNAEQFRQSGLLKLVSVGWYLVVFIPAVIGTWACRRNLGCWRSAEGRLFISQPCICALSARCAIGCRGSNALLVLSAVGWQVIVPALRTQSAGLATE